MIFIGAGTWWAFGRNLGKPYAYVLRLVQFVAASHLIISYIFQISFFQQFLETDSLEARLVLVFDTVRLVSALKFLKTLSLGFKKSIQI